MVARLTRRGFLALPLFALILPWQSWGEAAERTVRAYEVNVAVLFNLLRFTLVWNVIVDVDRAAGRYRVTMSGTGRGVSARSDSMGIVRRGRFMPTFTQSAYTVRGRENRLALSYDYERGVVSYRVVAYTFLLGRRWQVDDVARLAPGQHVDDLISAALNFAADTLDVDADGAFRVTVVRRARSASEGPDDVSPTGYRAELATVRFRAVPEAATGGVTALVDLTGFSSWARPTRPARVVFGADRYLESASSALILGTTFTLRLVSAS
jgi:hypothetical protein